jgi:hypothetical protein
MDTILLCFNIEVYVFRSITKQKIVKIPIIFYLMHGGMFRLCLQPKHVAMH